MVTFGANPHRVLLAAAGLVLPACQSRGGDDADASSDTQAMAAAPATAP